MAREEWRRANVNQFIENTCHSIHALKPWVKFGISPFGIWRPGFPKQIQGLDAYAKIYADSRLWLASGWLDYLSPQLYWPVDQQEQSFPVLLQWWSGQNAKHRHLWPSLNASNVGSRWKPDEITRQMQIVRRQPGVSGEIFYHLRNLFDNHALTDVVRAEYPQPALVPASPCWIPLRPTSRSSPSLKAAPVCGLNGQPPAPNRRGCGFCNSELTVCGRLKFCRQIKPRGPFPISSRTLSRSAPWTGSKMKVSRPRSRKSCPRRCTRKAKIPVWIGVGIRTADPHISRRGELSESLTFLKWDWQSSSLRIGT